ncbi:hypothetical protein [Streptomyces sp. NPDC005533]|uniref:DIP1984 family protein n=1 Tax=Streptomyces sp. NPDC005533 TaxID=3364723 RepID=UPI0036821159
MIDAAAPHDEQRQGTLRLHHSVLTSAADDATREIREIDVRIQRTNWEADLRG